MKRKNPQPPRPKFPAASTPAINPTGATPIPDDHTADIADSTPPSLTDQPEITPPTSPSSTDTQSPTELSTPSPTDHDPQPPAPSEIQPPKQTTTNEPTETNPNSKNEKNENIQPDPVLQRDDRHDDGAHQTPPEPPAGDSSPSAQDILQDSQSPGDPRQRPRRRQSPIPRREYTLWELIRHRDYDTLYPDDPDPADHVLASIRPSAWDKNLNP